MRSLLRHADKFAIGMTLACAGAGVGMAWSSMTSSAVVWQRPATFTEARVDGEQRVDHFSAGRSWAQAAYGGGLRRCPEMNADFVAACQAEMKALAARPDFVPGSYGGPLLVTAYTPPAPAVEEPALPVSEPIAEVESVEPAIVPTRFEPTPDNYPAAPSQNE